MNSRRKQSRTGRSALATVMVTVALLAATIVTSPLASEAQAPGVDVDLASLDLVPLRQWGVSGQTPSQTQTPSLDVLVWDFAQIGDRMFIGGAFLNAQENSDATPIPQRYVAAFDLNTGDWIDTWRPTIDRAVYSLANFNGKLIVGGEFQNVNGTPREGLVALDPLTGAIDPEFEGFVERPWSSKRAMVRTMVVDGDQLYVAGNFSHATGQWGTRTRVYKAARFTGSAGAIDTGWKPEVTGSGVWGMDVDPSRGEVHFAGYFSAVNGEANTGYFHTVNDSNGATVPGKIETPRNLPGRQPEFFDVTVGENTVWAIGEQHIVQTLRASDQQMLAYNTTGYSSNTFEYSGGFAGGAYQVGAHIGDYVFAGCHCTYSVRNGINSHHSSVTGQRTPHRLLMAYDDATGRLYEDFKPDIHSPRDGPWAVTGDTNGCLWIGGDFHVGGVDAGSPRWLGGFGRFCPEGFDPGGDPPPPPPGDALVNVGADWRYNDSGQDLGTAWRNPGYNDAAWAVGPAEFGFGEGDEATTFTSGYLTYYARTTFEFNGNAPSSLLLRLKADDGAVVYLNGTELVRDNMPAGPITASTQPVNWKGGADEDFVDYTVSADALVDGTNVLAVEVHNYWSGNSDLSLDLSLDESDENPPPPPAGPLVARGSSWNYVDDATQTPNGWPGQLNANDSGSAPFGFGENYIVTEVTAGNEAYYFTKTVNVADAGAIDTLTLGLQADDGAVVYINGVEVQRVNMPDGPIDWSTRPLNWVSGADEAMKDYTIDGAALVDGDNLIAVEIHNYWPGNSDLSFDLELD